MAIRIYSLAKELKLDSKVLVEICAVAGIEGKETALASLTDEQAEHVRGFIAGRHKDLWKAQPKKRTRDDRAKLGSIVIATNADLIFKWTDPEKQSLNVYLDPGESPPELIAELYMALSAVYRSVGGSGLEIAKGQLGVYAEDGALR